MGVLGRSGSSLARPQQLAYRRRLEQASGSRWMQCWHMMRTVDHQSEARLAQPAERKAINLVAVGSSPTVGVWIAHAHAWLGSLMSCCQELGKVGSTMYQVRMSVCSVADAPADYVYDCRGRIVCQSCGMPAQSSCPRAQVHVHGCTLARVNMAPLV